MAPCEFCRIMQILIDDICIWWGARVGLIKRVGGSFSVIYHHWSACLSLFVLLSSVCCSDYSINHEEFSHQTGQFMVVLIGMYHPLINGIVMLNTWCPLELLPAACWTVCCWTMWVVAQVPHETGCGTLSHLIEILLNRSLLHQPSSKKHKRQLGYKSPFKWNSIYPRNHSDRKPIRLLAIQSAYYLISTYSAL